MQSCDLIFAAYTKWRFTSGIVGKAAAVKVPILVNDGFVMAKRVTNFEIGFVKNEDKDIVEWLNENIQTIKNFKKSPVFIDGCLKYCERYGYEQWRKSLAQLIDNIES